MLTKEQVQAIVKASLEAASKIAAVTPNKWDDMITDIAKAISDQVFGLFGAEPAEMEPEVQQAIADAAEAIRAECDGCLGG